MSNEKDIALSSEYEYGFHDEDVSVYKTQKGLNEETVRTISKIKITKDILRKVIYYERSSK